MLLFLPLAIGVLTFSRPPAADADADTAPPAAVGVPRGGTPVLPADWRANLLSQWTKPNAFGAVESTADGVRLVTRTQPEHLYGLQAVLLTRTPVKKGDTMLIRFAARSLQPDKSTGVTKISVTFSKASPEWDSSYKGEIGLGAEWQRYDIPFTCKKRLRAEGGAGRGHVRLSAQVAEIADLQVLNIGRASRCPTCQNKAIRRPKSPPKPCKKRRPASPRSSDSCAGR
jgi:hypothetical protein